MPRELHVYDFDGTLFRSPQPPPRRKTGWWWSIDSLSPPCVPDEPGQDWWVEDVVSSALASIDSPDVYTVLMTGRPDRGGFRERIEALLESAGLLFDEVRLLNKGRTPDFKISVLKEILDANPDITHVTMWDDNEGYLSQYEEFVESRGVSIKTHLIVAESRECDLKLESRYIFTDTVRRNTMFKSGTQKGAVGNRLRKILKEELGVSVVSMNDLQSILPEPVVAQMSGRDTMPEECIHAMQKVHHILRAQYQSYQTSHWQVMGTSFYGNHLLFQRLYGSVTEDIDGLGEKLVAYSSVDAVCPAAALECMLNCVEQWMTERDHIKRGLRSEADLCAAIDALYASCDKCGFKMPRGLDDFMAALANAHETNKYLLKQSASGV